MLVIMAGRHSWRGIYKVLIPHLVCLLWWQMFTELFVHTTWQSLVRASVGWVIFITMLPLVFVYIVGVFLLNFLQWFLVLDLAMKLAVAAVAIGASSVIVLYSNVEIPQDVRKRRKQVLIAVALVVFCLLGPIFYVNYIPAKKGTPGIKLTWNRYDALCGPKARKDHTEAVLQATCGDFVGETVTWKGSVTSVKVVNVDNRFRTLVTAMPKVLRPTLRCLLGGEAEKGKDRYVSHRCQSKTI
jgi:wolfamin